MTQLDGFKAETQATLAEYRKAIAATMEKSMSDRSRAQLTTVARFEAQMAAQLQETIVRETANSFKDTFLGDKGLQDAAIDNACQAIAGKAPKADPLKDHFIKSITEVGSVDLGKAKANPKGSIVERVAAVQQEREMQFQSAFMVTQAEAAEVKKLGKAALAGDSIDLTKLDADSLKKLETLFTSINNKVGYTFPTVSEIVSEIKQTGDATADKFLEHANHQVSLSLAKLHAARLNAFVRAFA